jgi:hypothetical protein
MPHGTSKLDGFFVMTYITENGFKIQNMEC